MAAESQSFPVRRRQPKQARSQERVNHILDVAERLFIENGYEPTTTRAIAARAEVPVGSLYQFFPDKEAILRALAERYFAEEYRMFIGLHAELSAEPMAIYVDRMIDAFDQFATERPGYRAVLAQLIDLMTVRDLTRLDDYDQQILQGFTQFLAQRNSKLDITQCELIATTVVKTVNELLWLSLTRDAEFHQQMIAETKTLITAYLSTYQL